MNILFFLRLPNRKNQKTLKSERYKFYINYVKTVLKSQIYATIFILNTITIYKLEKCLKIFLIYKFLSIF